MHNNPFIALEGGEGVGKTTQRKLLEERLPGLFPEQEFVFTFEPGGTRLGSAIREVILSEDAREAGGKTMFHLFAAARLDHQIHRVVPELEAGKVVVTDRYAAATFAYQVMAQDDPITKEKFTTYYYELLVRPALTIILDLDPDVAQARVQARAGQDSNHFDTRLIEFHHRLRDGYLQFQKDFYTSANQVVIVSADQQPEAVHAEIVAHIRERLARL